MRIAMKKKNIIKNLEKELKNQNKIIEGEDAKKINILYYLYLKRIIKILKKIKYKSIIEDIDALFIMDEKISYSTVELITAFMKKENIKYRLNWLAQNEDAVDIIDDCLKYNTYETFPDILNASRLIWLKDKIFDLVAKSLNLEKLSATR